MADNDSGNTASKEISNAEDLIRYYTLWSAGAGALPIPLVDLVAMTGVQVQMIHELATLYNVEFSSSRTKALLTSLVGSVAARLFASAVKVVPVIGHAVGLVSLPILGGATTYAVGRVFNMHFAAGGTLLDLNVDKVREYYRSEFARGKKVVAGAGEVG